MEARFLGRALAWSHEDASSTFSVRNHVRNYLLFKQFSLRYQKNLKCLYVVHPTFRMKFMTWWFTTFTAPEVKHKVRFLTGVEFLYDSVSPEQLDIPQFIMDCDSRVSQSFFQSFTIKFL